jgi:hypothetical protein
MKEIVQRELGLRKFSRQWVPHSLSQSQTIARATKDMMISTVLYDRMNNSVNGFLPGHSWFVSISESDRMFGVGRNEAVPKEKQTIRERRFRNMQILCICPPLRWRRSRRQAKALFLEKRPRSKEAAKQSECGA